MRRATAAQHASAPIHSFGKWFRIHTKRRVLHLRIYARVSVMCRNIKTLFNFDPPVTTEEVRAASLQFVRKISGFNKPSKANEQAFHAAVDQIAALSARFLSLLETSAPPKNREEERLKAQQRSAERFGN